MSVRARGKTGTAFPGGAALFLILLLCGSCAARGDGAAQQHGLPPVKRDCGTCHSEHGGSVAGLLKTSISGLCLRCHADRAAPNEHAVDIVPSMQVTRLPLREGRMTCVTCHDPHSNEHGSLLRLPRSALCQACHRK